MSSQQRRSAYSNDSSPYANGGRASNGGGSGAYRQQPGGYPVGSGRTYTSSRATGGAQGVRPVSPYNRDGRHGGAGRDLGRVGSSFPTRRAVIAGLAGLLGVGCFGFVGYSWHQNRAVSCTVNGTLCKARANSSGADLIEAGYVHPTAGNLLAITAEGEDTWVVGQQQGNPYTLTVNGEEVDPDAYRLAGGDDLVFSNGTDRYEDVDAVNTDIPCSTQLADVTRPLVSIGYVAQWGKDGVSTVETGKVSGNRVDRGVTQEPQDLVIASSGINPDDGRKLVALTFDDGPHLDYTPQYLEILAKYGAKATFFNVGTNLDGGSSYEELARRVVEEGHQLASHTYTHNMGTLTSLDDETVAYEIKHTFDLIEQITGTRCNVFRAPFGEFYSNQFHDYLLNGDDYNIAYCAYWTVDSLDWEMEQLGYGVEEGAQQIVANATANLDATNYNGAIVLMHDGGGDRSRDVIALPQIIEKFQSYGYELVTLNEMIQADSSLPSWVGQGYVDRPADAVVPADVASDGTA
jgi:peptidoglycan/xylan/chitin deacetylase (PgdA/CDA1 family)